ncbi:hypothetical protein DINM_005180 [Dirofilaria immitis]|nr:hypothetical protein [Dirofilaria immitis]
MVIVYTVIATQPAFTMEQASKALKAYKERKKHGKRHVKKKHATWNIGKLKFWRNLNQKWVFPRRRKGSMGFGERKAHYLSVRPKPCYATWLGKRRNVIEAKPSLMALAASINITDHSTVSEFNRQSAKESEKQDDASNLSKKSPAQKDSSPKQASQISTTNKQTEAQKRLPIISPEYEGDIGQIKMVTYGANADNPLINGVPFWTVETPYEEDEVTDDDLPVDIDILEKVCIGKKTLDSRPFEKIEFNPFGPVAKMKADDPLFDRDTILFSNTVETVIRLQPEGDEKITHPVEPLPRRIRWADKISVTTFDPKNRRPREVRIPKIEPLRNIARDRSPTSFRILFDSVAKNGNDGPMSNGRVNIITLRMIHIVMSVDDISIVAESHRSAEQKDRFGNVRLSVTRRNQSK